MYGTLSINKLEVDFMTLNIVLLSKIDGQSVKIK